jgi:hypothetical protein
MALARWPARLVTAMSVAYHEVGTFQKLVKDYNWFFGPQRVPFEQESKS